MVRQRTHTCSSHSQNSFLELGYRKHFLTESTAEGKSNRSVPVHILIRKNWGKEKYSTGMTHDTVNNALLTTEQQERMRE